jgi:molybdopterin molybdotransferase
MESVESHLAHVLAAIRPLAAVCRALESAEGGVLAQDVMTRSPLPSFDNSAMDGYAVRAADVAAATESEPVSLPVCDEIPAGDIRALSVKPGTCMRIMTGAMLPGGVDTIVPVEWSDGGRDRVLITRAAEPGHAVRRCGEDVPEGAVLLQSGTRLGPAQIALLASGGHGSARVRPRPRVAVIATGAELTEPGDPLAPGRIWDSNSYMLAAAARQAGCQAVRRRVTDDPDAVLAALEDAARDADLLITSGGVSMGGEHDVVKAALEANADFSFRKVAMQPGMPQGFGVTGPARTPIFTLPGNPVSAFVSFHLFVRPALDALQGLSPSQPQTARAFLADGVRSPAHRRSYLRGVYDPEGGVVRPVSGQGSHQVGALAGANVLIVVPEGVVWMEAGEAVDVISLP